MLGIHATADAVNRLAISSNASLFNNAGARASGEGEQAGGERYGKPLYQTNWTGFAKMGLNGSNDFSVKISSDTG